MLKETVVQNVFRYIPGMNDYKLEKLRAVQSRRCRHNALRVFKWKCAHYSRVVPV
jgi:hypothetical protein